MHTRRHLIVLITSVLATAAWAQSVHKPLNLALPPESLTSTSSAAAPAHAASVAPAAAASAATAAAAITNSTAKPRASQPGVYYGDTSGRMGNTDLAQAPSCDDSTYNQPQVHGSVGMGVVGGNHFSGNYQTGTVHLTQAFGSCDHPSGGLSISIGVSQGDFHGPRRGH